MQLLIVATVSRFTSPWPLWQQRSGDEGRQLTGAPGWCCHQVYLLNLTRRQERRDRERGGKKAEEKDARAREWVGEKVERNGQKLWEEDANKRKMEDREHALERERISVRLCMQCVWLCALWNFMPVLPVKKYTGCLWTCEVASPSRRRHSGGLTSLLSGSGDGETAGEK